METMSDPHAATMRSALFDMLAKCRVPKLRSMREFAEEEIVIPDGPFKGLRFSCRRQPYTRLLYEAIDSGQWNRFFVTGPTQSGKSLSAWVIPVMYHLFEVGETVIAAVPKKEMSADKWREDLRPAIEASRYRDLLPKRGAGSRDGGELDAVKFLNGATLKFMAGGGSDKARAAFTSRVVVITETDGMDESGGTSREADKITQIEARTRAFGNRKRIYAECTVSIEEGRTWREYQNGTATKIIRPCPHCKAWVTPERENLEGWRDADTLIDARHSGRFVCPECAEPWTEAERLQANAEARLLHRGQEVTPDGEVVGTPAPTETLGFRWSAVDNHFLTPGDFAADEWRGARAEDEENAEKELRQFVWAIPYDPPRMAATDLKEDHIMERQGSLRKGFIPDHRSCVTVGADVGKREIYWTAIAWLPEIGGRIIDYGIVDVPSSVMNEQQAILTGLRNLRDFVEQGWKTPQGEDLVPPSRVWVDAHWNTPTVKAFCAESGSKWWPSIGFGHGKYFGGQKTGRYAVPVNPTGKSSVGAKSDERYHMTRVKGDKREQWQFDADHWKTELHKRLACVAEDPAAILLYKVESRFDHMTFAKHICAEKEVVEFIPGEGDVIHWERIRHANHWLDATVLALLSGHSTGNARMLTPRIEQSPAVQQKAPREGGFVRKLNMRSGSFVRRR